MKKKMPGKIDFTHDNIYYQATRVVLT